MVSDRTDGMKNKADNMEDNLNFIRGVQIGETEKIVLESIDSMFVMPDPDQLIRQRFTLHADGRGWLSDYSYDRAAEYNRSMWKRMKARKLKTDAESAQKLLKLIRDTMEQRELGPMLRDAGEWILTIYDSEGRHQEYRSSLNRTKKTIRISDAIRACFPDQQFIAFDGDLSGKHEPYEYGEDEQ